MSRPTPITRSLTEVPGWLKKQCERCGGDFWSVPSQFKYTRFCAKDCRHMPWQERLWANVIKGVNPEDCWTFKLAANGSGYPYLKKDGVEERVSRLMWEIHNGPVPEGKVVRHCCRLYRADKKDNVACINPLHLTTGTQLDNVNDMKEAGTLAKGETHGNAILTEEIVRQLRAMKEADPKMTLKTASELTGIKWKTIHNIWSGKNWKHI